MPKKKLTKTEQKELNEELFEYIEENDLNGVKTAIQNGALVNIKDDGGYNPLNEAIQRDISIIEYLLSEGAEPNIQDGNGQTPLHTIVSHGESINKANLLLKYGANMYIKDNDGETPFVIAEGNGCNTMAEFFISQGYEPSKEDLQLIKNHKLIKAVYTNDLSAVKDAVESGAEINKIDSTGFTSLYYCTHPCILKYLLSKGGDPNIQMKNGMTLLGLMIKSGNLEAAKVLFKYGALLKIKNKQGKILFNDALSQGYYIMAELMVLNGYIPSNGDFNSMKNTGNKESVKTHLMVLASHMQEHKESLKEEAKIASQEFAYADEIMEM